MRLWRICSEIKDLKSDVKDLKRWFLRRSYPQRIVEEQMDRTFRLPLKHDTKKNKIESGIPLVVTYNPAFRIYLRHCGNTLIFFTQMRRLERFLCQVHLSPIEALETLRDFW